MELETLYYNDWLTLKKVKDPANGVDGYIYSHEQSCQGFKVAVLPYRRDKVSQVTEFLVKSEVTPCWSMHPIKSAVTGGYEGVDICEDAIREVLEETGYEISIDMLQYLGTCYASKSADTVYTLYAVDLTDMIPGEMLGDGTRLESEAECFWISLLETESIKDAQFSTMVLRWILLQK